MDAKSHIGILLGETGFISDSSEASYLTNLFGVVAHTWLGLSFFKIGNRKLY